jgi:hypothetical protein
MSSPFPSVIAKYVQFSTPLEGDFCSPYPDNRNLITIGIGCLLDTTRGDGPPSFGLARGLPWVLPDCSTPTDAEVVRQLTALKALNLRNYAASSHAVTSATTIRLTQAGVLALATTRVNQDWTYLASRFPAIGTWPADAQLFALSISWAEGPAWDVGNPNLARVLRLAPPDFLSAIMHAPDTAHPGQYLAAAADISTKGNPGIVPRNAQNELALSNAQVVLDQKLPIDVLYWPRSPLEVAPATTPGA